MKINLLLGNAAGVLNGYVNVDPLAPDGDRARVPCDLAKLDEVVSAGEAVELIADGLIDHVPHGQADALLTHWVSRLAHGGVITVTCVDLMEVTKSLQNRLVSPGQANSLLHGEQNEPWQYRYASYTTAVLADTLAEKGLTIEKKRVVGWQAVVVARRP